MQLNLPENFLVAESPARLGWQVRHSEAIFDDPPYLVLQAVPDFPGCSARLQERGIVWDVFSLIDSVGRPGAHQLLTCECGYGPDAGLTEPVLVSHPDANTVVWELDIAGLRPALAERYAAIERGFVRLLFKRDECEADLRRLVADLQRKATTPVNTADLPAEFNAQHLLGDASAPSQIQVGELEPDRQGLALERLLALSATDAWPRTPLWPAGTLVEFGFFAHGDGHSLVRVDGDVQRVRWAGELFSRWHVSAAFQTWTSHTQRAYWLATTAKVPSGVGQNAFVLIKEADRTRLHADGRSMAALFRAAMEECNTAPGVWVEYRECPIASLEAGAAT